MKIFPWLFLLIWSLSGGGEGARAAASICAPAVGALKGGQFKKAADLAGGRCPLVGDAALWMMMQKPKSPSTFQDITAFLMAHPQWPKGPLLRMRAEEAMTESTPDSVVLAWFDRGRPVTSAGSFYYAHALRRKGRIQDLKSFVRHVWRTQIMGAGDARRFRTDFKGYLGNGDDLARADMLLSQERIKDGEGVLPYLTARQKQWFQNRSALIRGAASAFDQSGAFLRQIKDDPILRRGLAYDRVKFMRRKESPDGLRVYGQVSKADQALNPSLWWVEKNALCRQAIDRGDFRGAYRVAAGHGLKNGKDMAEAEFLLGWIALRFLSNPTGAMVHFETLYRQTKRPLSQARAAFWAGLTQETLGAKEVARQWYGKAAQYPSTFYGQLAADKIQKKLSLTDETVPLSHRQIYGQKPLVQLAILLYQTGYQGDGRAVLDHLSTRVSSRDDVLALIDLAGRLDPHHQGWVVNNLSQDHELFTKNAYPILSVPSTRGVSPALTHAIIRQESCFNPRIISFDFGHGLMQLMEPTAKKVCRDHGLPFSKERLTADGGYNMTLGTRYLAGLLDDMDGAAILAIPSYNAGPGAVKKWIERNGDPRALSGLALVDWIERIPFKVTRGYVQRVLANKRVYDALLSSNQQNGSTIR